MTSLPPASRRRAAAPGRRAILAGAVLVPALALGAPALAEPEEDVRDVDLAEVPFAEADGHAVRELEGAGAAMIGCTWRGAAPDEVAVRAVLPGQDAWTPWFALDPLSDPEDGRTVSATQAIWLGGASERLQVRANRGSQDVTEELLAHLITVRTRAADRTLAAEPTAGPAARAAAEPSASTIRPGLGAPPVVPRAGWGADESLVGSDPSTAAELKAAVLHHSEGSNTYSAAEVPGILRGYLRYHTQTQGWNDIGYNALVDRFGTIWEGRRGGLERHVVGAHATGSNTGSVGVCMIGSFTSVSPPSVMLEAVADVMAWKLGGVFIQDVASSVTLDEKVQPRVIGHKDARSVSTDCPGVRGYAALGDLRARVQQRLPGVVPELRAAHDAAGGRAALGTVTRLAVDHGDLVSVLLSEGIVISGGGAGATAHPTPFAESWEASWGRPITAATASGGRILQGFEQGTAVLENGAVSLQGTRFRDVPLNLAFAPEIEEIAARGIATGWPDQTFRPLARITRDAMVAFVHRALGASVLRPPALSPFTDLAPGDMFYAELCWAHAQGIVEGYPDGTVRPVAPVERQAVAAFLHRAAGSPAPAASAPRFTDVPATSPFAEAISWLAGEGITTGWPDGSFRPQAATARDGMAAFLIRWLRSQGR